jgi:hypothetical protein
MWGKEAFWPCMGSLRRSARCITIPGALVFLLGTPWNRQSHAQQISQPSPPQAPVLLARVPDVPFLNLGPAASTEIEDPDVELPDDPATLPSQTATTENATSTSQEAVEPEDAADASARGKQTRRILYIVPNFRSVSSNAALPRQSPKEKFKTATLDSLDYSSFAFYAAQAGIGLAANSYPEFRSGAAGYGRYYWHTLADSTSENYWVEFLIPSVLHQDTRYYTLGSGAPAHRFLYAFTRTMITRTDEGNETINASELVGAGAAAGMANLYYPSPERTFTKTYQRWVTSVLIDGGTFVFKEFWPDLNNHFFHQQE